MKKRGSLFLVLLSIILTAGCGKGVPLYPKYQGESGTEGGGGEVTAADGGDRAADGDSAISEGKGDDREGGSFAGKFDLSERLRAGQVRAGIITKEEEFIGGPNSREEIGDVKIYNSKIAVVIEGARRSHGFIPYGGTIAAADVIRPEGESGKSYFGEFGLGFNHYIMEPTSVKIVNDGSQGGEAVVRIEGKPRIFALLISYIKAFLPNFFNKTTAKPSKIAYEYRLKADSPYLECRFIVKNEGSKSISINFIEVGIFMGDGLRSFYPGEGFIYGSSRSIGGLPNGGAVSYLGFANGEVGYLLVPSPESGFKIFTRFKNAVAGFLKGFSLKAKGEKSFQWKLFVGRDLAEAQKYYNRTQVGYRAGVVRGRAVEEGSGDPIPRTIINIEKRVSSQKLELVSQTWTRKDGTFEVELPLGNYLFSVYRPSGVLGKKVVVDVGAGSNKKVTLYAPALGRLEVVATDRDTGAPLPVRVSVFAKKKIVIPKHYGVPEYSRGAAAVFFPYSGSGEIQLPVGQYTVIVSRGFFYSTYKKQITISPNQKTVVVAQIQKLLQMGDILSGDFHIHAKNSADSEDTNELKVAAMAGEGLDLAISTDHEYLTDYEPTIQKMKLTKWIRGIVGEEITTHFGHFNAFPLPYDPKKHNNGIVPWYGKAAPEMFKFVFQMNPEAVLQINHPRGMPGGAYFSYVGYDRATDKAVRKPAEWSNIFNAIEVFNGKHYSRDRSQTFLDWVAMLNWGRRVTATGNSDSHRALVDECGYPRNLILIGTDNPRDVQPSEVAAAVRSGKVIVSGGILVRIWAADNKEMKNSVGIGDTVKPAGGEIYLKVRIEAAPRIDVSTLEIFVNGKSLIQHNIKDNNKVLRLEKVFSIKLKKDSWIIALVTGKGSVYPFDPRAVPFGLTNPIFVDFDGDGKFTAPNKN